MTVLVCKTLEGTLRIKQTNVRRLNKLNKLELAHRSCRSIKLSNNPSGKKVTLLASSFLWKHRLIKVILMNNWSILISYELIFLQLLIPLKSNLHFSFFVFQAKKGYFLQSKIQKHIFGHRACLQVKGEFVDLKKVTIQEKPPFCFWCAR